jgi:AcrR family transcriptional regulator
MLDGIVPTMVAGMRKSGAMVERGGRRRGAAFEPGRPRSSDERWQAILDAAAEIFAAKGYERTTTRDIADAVGILSGSLYYYIRTKEDLLYALIEDFHQLGRDVVAEAEEESGGEGGPLGVLAVVIARSVALNARNGARTAVFHNDFRHLADDRKNEIIRNRREHESHVEDLIRQSQRESQIRESLDPRLTTLSILSMVNSIHNWYRPGRGLSPEELGDFQADLIVRGLSSPATGRGRRG